VTTLVRAWSQLWDQNILDQRLCRPSQP